MSDSQKKFEHIFWDMDGTIVIPKERLHSLFCELAKVNMSYEEYWNLKKKGMLQKDMLNFVNYQGDYTIFKEQWMSNVERSDLLKKDKLVENVHDILTELNKRGYKMYIVTNRQNYVNLINQLKDLEIFHCFEKIVSTEQKCTKAEVIRSNGLYFENAIFIGDSAEDINAARELRIKSVLFSDKTENEKEKILADYYIRNYDEVKGILQ